jgi:hypothetical protein
MTPSPGPAKLRSVPVSVFWLVMKPWVPSTSVDCSDGVTARSQLPFTSIVTLRCRTLPTERSPSGALALKRSTRLPNGQKLTLRVSV